jgi:hypothetical protein
MTSVERDAVANKDKQKSSGDILGNPYILLKPAVYEQMVIAYIVSALKLSRPAELSI